MLDALRKTLQQQRGVRLALLFGSVARGTAGEGSDLDLAVDVDENADVLAIAADLSRTSGREAHVVLLRDATIPLTEELVRDAIVIHEGSEHAGARWRSQALLSLDLDGPWYARMRDAWLKHVASKGLGHGQS